MSPLVLPLLEFGARLIDKFVTDPNEKAKAEFDLLKEAQSGELSITLKQLEINLAEAQSTSLFVSGWRPFVGWGCGLGLLWATIFHNIIAWVSVIYGFAAPPVVDTDTLIYVLGGLLGIAGLRTYEKKNGVN